MKGWTPFQRHRAHVARFPAYGYGFPAPYRPGCGSERNDRRRERGPGARSPEPHHAERYRERQKKEQHQYECASHASAGCNSAAKSEVGEMLLFLRAFTRENLPEGRTTAPQHTSMSARTQCGRTNSGCQAGIQRRRSGLSRAPDGSSDKNSPNSSTTSRSPLQGERCP